ncbi:FtsX-like permease family protein [Lysinibacillus sp. LZ02]|uniref:FtsX-like permease family protein n=1 Tax=Lysinibacillus sp. LZ02 TaxID=3420668 RepID=UPI003D36821B
MTFQQFAYRNVFRNFRNYAAFFMASFFSVFVFFLYSMLMFHPDMENGFLGEASIIGMVFAEVILVLFSWFFIFYSMKAFLQARSKEFAILLHLGMERQQLGRLVFLETMLIGALSSISGILFGFAFSKFFFMIIREMLSLEDLPLYVSWGPFLLTFAVFMGAFIIISIGSVMYTPEHKLTHLLKARAVDVSDRYSKGRAILGLVLIGIGYMFAVITTKTTLFTFTLLIPIVVTFGTFYFFTDTVFFIFDLLKRRKDMYWHKACMLSVAEQIYTMRQNAKMFFVVTMVSMLAFLCVVLLAALSSYTAQYDKLNPLGIVYKGHFDNPYEKEHVSSIINELEEQGFSYHVTRFQVIKQTSLATSNEVEVFRETDINRMLFSYGLPLVRLNAGEGMFIPYSDESIKTLEEMTVETVLTENNVPITIDRVYPKIIFPTSIISRNSIIISDEDYKLLTKPLAIPEEVPSYHLYAFDIPHWIEAKDIGLSIQQLVSQEYVKSTVYSLPFYFENTGLNYSYILAMYSLFTVSGVLVVIVFLMAAGSFIYFKLYANLERERQQFAVLKRMGLTDAEQKRLITRHLAPQFFLPWGMALLHSTFAFIALQSVLKDVINLIIVKEIIVAFFLFVCVQVVYFYMIRWRYIAHVND